MAQFLVTVVFWGIVFAALGRAILRAGGVK